MITSQYIKLALLGLLAVFTGALLTATPLGAVDLLGDACDGVKDSAVCASKDEGSTREAAAGEVQTVVNFILFLLGIVAVIMIIYGGFRYVASGGDPTGTQNAKNTILYAVIGLIVAMLSYAIVNFFIFGLQGSS